MAQNTLAGVSYCPSSFSRRLRTRPRQKGYPNLSSKPPAAPAYSKLSLSCQEWSFGAQAAQYGHSVRREFAFLAAHSALHFLGYDHETPAERAQMEDLQRRALDAAGYTRDIK